MLASQRPGSSIASPGRTHSSHFSIKNRQQTRYRSQQGVDHVSRIALPADMTVRNVVAKRGPGWILKTRSSSSNKGAPKMSTNSARWLPMIACKLLSSSVASSRRLVGSAPWALRIWRRLGSNCGISKCARTRNHPGRIEQSLARTRAPAAGVGRLIAARSVKCLSSIATTPLLCVSLVPQRRQCGPDRSSSQNGSHRYGCAGSPKYSLLRHGDGYSTGMTARSVSSGSGRPRIAM